MENYVGARNSSDLALSAGEQHAQDAIEVLWVFLHHCWVLS